jgi:hypothetical protein
MGADNLSVTTGITMAFLAVGLAASSGLNTFLPLLLLALAAKYHLFHVQLNGSFAWLSSDLGLGVLSVATIIEIIGDKIPCVDHALDVIGTLARPAAGALAAASVWTQTDPATAAVLGLIIGAPAAFGLHAAKAGTRAASTTTTLGFANPVLSLIEDTAAVLLSVVALAAPLLVPVLLVLTLLLLLKLVKKVRRRRPWHLAQAKRS